MKPHIEAARKLWTESLKKGDIVIDATCGNGNDTLFLSQLVLTDTSGKVFAIDIQNDAVQITKSLISESLPEKLAKRVHYVQQCHSTFPKEILPESVKLVVYNLGYLPKGNKSITTLSSTSLLSIQSALQYISSDGLVSITCYPGHEEGEKETNEILAFCSTLDPKLYECCHHSWINKNKSPSLLIIRPLVKLLMV